jgi:hypothetical protein
VVRVLSSLLGPSLPERVVKRARRRAPSSGNAPAGFGLPLHDYFFVSSKKEKKPFAKKVLKIFSVVSTLASSAAV